MADVLGGRARVVGSRTHVGRHDLGLPPGVVSPYEVREVAGLRYGDPPIEEARYERHRTLVKDAGVLARLAVTRLLPRPESNVGPPRDAERVRIVSANVDALDTAAAIGVVMGWLERRAHGLVFFVHPHALNLASNDTQLRDDIASADLILPDGIGMRVAASILGAHLPANVNGTDLLPELLLELAAHGTPIALIGGKPGVAERAAATWAKGTSVRIAGTWDGYKSDAEYEEIAKQIGAAGPCVVLIAFGSPLQERFAVRHFKDRAGVVAITVGGLFDFAAGDKPRAPLAWRELGLEWVWRFVHEPKRLGKRYLVGNPEFVARALAQRLRRH
jgi:N-acetylglucosaminyldiphosphoundecaprenol N-acetyl-beta-D-mannosaminyltransferase